MTNHSNEPAPLTDRQRQVLDVIQSTLSERGFPPSVREICEEVGLTSPSTVHTHLQSLQRLGYLTRDPSKPRAISVRFDPNSGATADRAAVKHVPLIGDVAAGTGVLAHPNVEELLPLPASLTGEGELFMLRVRGDSMIELGIFDKDFVVVKRQPTAEAGQIVVAGIPGDEATVKTYKPHAGGITLMPANPAMEPLEYGFDEVEIFGRVVTVLRSL